MMYDPISRGPHPVGVRTCSLERAGRTLPVELWYPAADEHAGLDMDPERRDSYEVILGFPPAWQEAVRDARPRQGRRPLILFSHGYGGHRRQSTFLCTHLASHGYVVAAVDHTGNTVIDVAQAILQMLSGGARIDPAAILDEFITHRPDDVRYMLDQVLAGTGGVAELIDAERIGMAGHSFGGWTTLVVTSRDRRIRAALPLAPAGGETHLQAEALARHVEVDFGRPVPTTYIAADLDSLLPLDGIRALYRRTTGPARLVVLESSDHMHFMDRIAESHELFRSMPQDELFAGVPARMKPMTELMPEAQAFEAVRSIGLAHFDAVLKEDAAAAAWMAELDARLRTRGVRLKVE